MALAPAQEQHFQPGLPGLGTAGIGVLTLAATRPSRGVSRRDAAAIEGGEKAVAVLERMGYLCRVSRNPARWRATDAGLEALSNEVQGDLF